MMEESEEYTCDLCKISYAAETELKEHVFSLMHHIKMEKKQKGVTHHCSLCLMSCSNIIEYGKHLNEDKHKQSVEKSRRALDDVPNPKPTDLDLSREKDDRNIDNLEDSSMDLSPVRLQFQIPEPSSKHRPKGSHNSSSDRGRLNHTKHQRSFSQPEIKSKRNGIQVPRVKEYEEDFRNDFVYLDKQGQSMDGGYLSGQFPRGVQAVFDNTNWHNVKFIDYEHFDPRNQFHMHSGNNRVNHPHWYEDNITEEFYTDFQNGNIDNLREKERLHQRFGEYSEMNISSNKDNHFRRQDHMNHSRHVSNHLHGGSRENGDEFLGRGRVNNIRETRLADRKDPESVIQQATTNLPQDGPVEDHAPKRRRHDDEMISANKSRKGNRNEKMDFQPSSRPSSVTRKHHATSHNRERNESPVKDISVSLRNSGGDFVKNISQKEESKSRRSSIDEHKNPLSVHESLQSSGISSLQSSTMSSLGSSELCDSGFVSSPKPLKGKKKDTVVGKSQGSKKSATEKYKHGSKKSPGQNIEENAETVLERAERLCKDLRDKRETAKKERNLKEKQKKLEKHQELNNQLEALSSKNMENIKGHLNPESLDNSTNSQFARSLPSRLADSDCSLTGQGETKQLSRTGSLSGLLNSRSNLDSLASSGLKQKEDIDRIRQTIENSVRGGSSSPVARSANTPSSWPTSPISPIPILNTLAKTKILDKEHLCKLVNTPRSHKERLQLAQLLRTYASTRNKLSLPRFNLQMSGIYDKLENQTEGLENLSPDVQLQIAQLIEADAKPNLQELESILNFGSLSVGTSLSGDVKHAEVIEQSAASPTKEPSMAPKHHADVCNTQDLLRGIPNQYSPLPSKVEPRDAISPSPRMDMDTSPAMTLQDLATDVSKSKQSFLTTPDLGLSRMPFSPLMSIFPERNRPIRVTSPDQDLAANVPEAGKGTTEKTLSSVVIKQEKVDNDYNVGLSNNTSIKTECPDDFLASGYTEMSPVRDSSRGLLTRATVKEFFSASMSPSNHAVTRVTIQPNDEEERPVRDLSNPFVMPTLSSSTPAVGLGVKSRHSLPLTTHQISSTITDVPAIYSSSSEKEREDKIKTIATTTLKTCPEVDTRMAETRSVVSQESGNSVLDQVYQLSLREEEIRKEIDTSDHRMSQLRRLITEATNQLEKYTQKREMLLKEEVQLRSKRMKLLHESRSTQGSTTGPLQGMDSLGLSSPTLSRPQTENYDNPMLMKYLMSQQQHQFETASSVDGFSGVESGSQAELEKDPTRCQVNLKDRRGSFTSDISSVTQDDKHIGDSSVPGKTFKKGENQLKLEQQPIRPSGAVELMTDQSLEILSGSSTCSIHSSKPPAAESLRKDLEKKTSEEATSNSQLTLAGFVTLDSLLKNNTEIGKVFQKSLKGKDFAMILNPNSTVGPKKGASSDQNEIKHNKEQIQAKESVSDDFVHSGSDVEKPPKAPRISMKYMGSLPSEGLDTETLRQQIIGESKSSKQLTYTLLTSHDALEQLKKLSSESGMGTSVSLTQSQTASQTTAVDTAKIITRRGAEHADNDSNLDCLSIVSACSLGEKIKQICDRHTKDEDNMSQEPRLDTPRSGSQSDPDKTLVEEDLDKNLADSGSSASTGIVKDCFVVLDRLNVGCSKPVLVSEIEVRSSRIKKPKSHLIDLDKVPSKSGDNSCLRARTPSPMRKKLKTKRERDTQSRRKKKEGFILESSSDVNSAEEEDVTLRPGDSGQKLSLEGQNNVRTPGSVPTEDNMGPDLSFKKSLLDEVELETPTDSADETGVTLQLNRSDLIRDNNKLRVKPEVLKSFRAAVRNNLQSKSDTSDSQTSPSAIHYKGPNLPVAAIQVFRGDLYVCYHGSELRRFHLQTGECLKELDCSPFFVNCLHVTQASDTQNVLYTGGRCKKLMLFRPENFDILQSHDYDDQIKCLHQDWGRLYIGLSDGVVAIRSIKAFDDISLYIEMKSQANNLFLSHSGYKDTMDALEEDKKLDTFQCTDQPVCCMSTTSAGMTKLLCCGTADSLIYICDAMSGILLTMLHGHKRPPVCIKAFDQTVISGSLDSTLLAHNVNTGALEQSCSVHPDAVTDIGMDDKHIYTSCADKYIRCFDRKTWKLAKTCHGAGRRPLTVINVTDRLVITGNIDGLAEAVPLNKLDMQAVNDESVSSTAQ